MKRYFSDPNVVTEEAIKPIRAYCEERNYKCRGCRYSIKWIIRDYRGSACCIFGNCPCSWEVKEESK